jgi:hypothetical protein
MIKEDVLFYNKLIKSVSDHENIRLEILTLFHEQYKLSPFDSLVVLLGICITIISMIKVPIESFYSLAKIMFNEFYAKDINNICNECKSDSEMNDFLDEGYNPDLIKNRIKNRTLN